MPFSLGFSNSAIFGFGSAIFSFGSAILKIGSANPMTQRGTGPSHGAPCPVLHSHKPCYAHNASPAKGWHRGAKPLLMFWFNMLMYKLRVWASNLLKGYGGVLWGVHVPKKQDIEEQPVKPNKQEIPKSVGVTEWEWWAIVDSNH